MEEFKPCLILKEIRKRYLTNANVKAGCVYISKDSKNWQAKT